jgi:hypothetical protein
MEERKIGAFTKRVAFKEKPARQDHRPSNLPSLHPPPIPLHRRLEIPLLPPHISAIICGGTDYDLSG